MADPLLDVRDDLAGIGLVPAAIEVLGHDAELDDKVAGQVLRLDLAAFLPPQPEQGRFVVAHDDPGVRAADEVSTVAMRLFHELTFMASFRIDASTIFSHGTISATWHYHEFRKKPIDLLSNQGGASTCSVERRRAVAALVS